MTISVSREAKLAARMVLRDTLRGFRARISRGVSPEDALQGCLSDLFRQIDEDKAALSPYRTEKTNGR